MSAQKDKSDKADAAPSNGNPTASQAKSECFVIMPISNPDGYEPGHFQRVYEDLFIPACDAAGYRAVRADEVRQTNLIHLDVLQKIIESPMALCDLSSRNPNVLFELGLRQAFDKPVVLVQEVGTPPIFDINPLRYASYRREMLYRQVIEDQREITDTIKETRQAIGNNKSINSIVKLLSLTHGASLANISEGEKESAFLQLIMNEISNLRSDVNRIARQDRPLRQAKAKTLDEEPIDEFIGPISPQIKLLERSVVSLRVRVDAWVRGESNPTALSPSELAAVLDELMRQREILLKHSIAIGNDLDVEYLALLHTQIKVIKNRLDKFLKSTKEDIS